MSILRKIQRNKLKNSQQSNRIRKAWRTLQVEKYSIDGYCKLYNKNNKKKVTKMKPVDVYMV